MPEENAQAELIKWINANDPDITVKSANNEFSYAYDKCIQNKGSGNIKWSSLDKTFGKGFSTEYR